MCVSGKNTGFTLLEMALVILVISLLAGSIIIAQSMIRNSQLQSVVQDVTIYTQAVTNFRDKYFALPGDFNGATALWGASTGDGNGDGVIVTMGTLAHYPASNSWSVTHTEQWYAWQHLALAGMISGSYTVGVFSTPGVNVPASQLPGAGWNIVTITLGNCANEPGGGNVPLGCQYAGIPYQNGDTPPNTMLYLTGTNTDIGQIWTTPVLTPLEAQTMDQKLDDGLPTTGKVLSSTTNPSGNNAPPWSSCYNAAGKYDLTQSGKLCALFFKTGL